MQKKKLICFFMITAIMLLCVLPLCGCGASDTDSSETQGSGSTEYISLSDLEGKRIGVATGSIQADQVKEQIADAELYYFSNATDMLNALRANKIDAFSTAEIIVRYMMTSNSDLTYLEEKLDGTMDVAAIFPKTDAGQALCDQYSDFITEIKETGEYDEIEEMWLSGENSEAEAPDVESLSADNGTLSMGIDSASVPFVCVKNGKYAGIDVEIAYRFCKEYGYGLEISNMDFGALVTAVATGKCDFASSGIAYTQERAESVLFSKPYYVSQSVAAVLQEAEQEGGFLSSIIDSFEKTFIRESRWKLFVKGIANTVIITVLSAVFGTLLGFAVYLMCRRGNRIANKITGGYVWLVQGMPMVVLLMILYYIIFGKSSLSGLAVSVVGFTLTFGASMYGMLQSGVNAIDKGQTEGAYALGYNDRDTFFQIILPQAATHFMPEYKSQIVSLLKGTSIVGYIAVEDLTKIGDIVRSQTYEAFFPLIAVTVIYFIIAGILIRIVRRAADRMEPKNRTAEKVLKGVKTHD